MRTLSANDTAQLLEESTTWANCVHVVDANGNEVRYTDHDREIVVNRTGDPLGINGTYEPVNALTGSSLHSTADMSVDNQESDVTLEDLGITASDIRAGLYDDVRVTLFRVNWRTPNDSGFILKHGPLGHKQLSGRGVATVELRGLTQYLQTTIVQTYSAACRADLGDSHCQFNLASVTITGTVSTVTSARLSFTSGDVVGSPNTAGYWTGGLVTFLTGNNATYRREVRSDNGSGGIVLFEPLPADIQVGDTFTIYPGCDKALSTCKNKFNNVINFRGEPFIPAPTNLTSGA